MRKPAPNTILSMLAPKLIQVEEQVLPAAVRLAEMVLASPDWKSPGTIRDANAVLDGFHEYQGRDLRSLTHWLKIYRNYDKYPAGQPFREGPLKRQIDLRMTDPKIFSKILESQKRFREECEPSPASG